MLFPIFVVMTLLEIYTLVRVGQSIGALSTVLLVVITALIGSILLKQQGLSTLAKVQNKIQTGNAPTFELFEGAVIVVCGVLLLTPGFITDGVGLLGLMPWSRKLIIKKIAHHFAVIFSKNTDKFTPQKANNRTDKPDDQIIEGKFWQD